MVESKDALMTCDGRCKVRRDAGVLYQPRGRDLIFQGSSRVAVLELAIQPHNTTTKTHHVFDFVFSVYILRHSRWLIPLILRRHPIRIYLILNIKANQQQQKNNLFQTINQQWPVPSKLLVNPLVVRHHASNLLQSHKLERQLRYVESSPSFVSS